MAFYGTIDSLIAAGGTQGASVRPSLLLDFANSKSLDPKLAFTRSSTATYYDGNTFAKAEENLIYYSQEIDNAIWIKDGVTVTTNATTAPNGTTTAEKIIPTAATVFHGFYQSFALTSNTPITLSAHFKSAGYNYAVLTYNNDVSSWFAAVIDLSTGTVLQSVAGSAATLISSSIASVGNNWYRLSVTGSVSTSAAGYLKIQTLPVAPNITPSFSYSNYNGSTGDGTNGIYVWGVQLEQRSNMTAYNLTTSAIITNSNMVLQTAPANAARFDHNPSTNESKGLLIEESKTNLLLYSQSSAGWNYAAAYSIVYDNVIIAPDGTLTGAKMVENTATITHGLNFKNSYAMTAGSYYTFSVYVKAGERSKGQINITNSPYSSTVFVTFDLSTGTVGSLGTTGSAVAGTPTITSVGNGWYRVSVTGAPATGTTGNATIFIDNGNGTYYTGDGRSGFYIWGFQIEAGQFPTSYIPTPITYTGRPSSATYKSSDGTIRIAPPNVARYEPNVLGGNNLLLETARTNYITYSDTIWETGIVGATVSRNATTAPDGSLTASMLTNNAGNISLFEKYVSAVSASSTNDYYVSLYVKPGNVTVVTFNCYYTGNSEDNVSFNFSTGAATGVPYSGEYIFDNVGGGWYRIGYRMTRDASGTKTQILFRLWCGARSSGVTGDYCYFWGAQCELGSTATSYIPSSDGFSSRSSTATYYDSQGLLRTAASGVPRYSYNPSNLANAPKLLLESQATNLVTYSVDASFLGVTNGTFTANSATAPDGTNTATLATQTGATTMFSGSGSAFSSISSGTTYTVSYFAKAGTTGKFYILFYGTYFNSGGTNPAVGFDLIAGTATVASAPIANYSISYVGNGWYRVSASCKATTTTTGAGIQIFRMQDPGTSVNMYVWGFQVETGATLTSYIPTAGATATRAADASTSTIGSRTADVYSSSAVTRAAESAKMSGSNFTSWYKQTEGTFLVDFYAPLTATDNYPRVFCVSDGTYNNLIQFFTSPIPHLGAEIRTSSTNQFGSSAANPITPGARLVAALAYKTNDSATVGNGAGAATDSTVILPVNLDRMTLDANDAGTYQLNSSIRKIAYYPKRLSNTELQNITTQ